MLPLRHQLELKILKNFLIEQAAEYNLGVNQKLRSVVSDMSIHTWADGSPANPAVWHVWQKILDFVVNEAKRKGNVYEQIEKEKSFVAAFRFLDDIFWASNNEITIISVIQELEKCFCDIEADQANPLWPIWCKYQEAEEGKSYIFD